MIRQARWLLLVAIAALTSATAWLVVTQREEARKDRPKAATPLPGNTSSTARDWTHDIKDGDRLKARIAARDFRQVKEPATFLLDGLEMRIYSAAADTYDLVKTSQATFDLGDGSMYAEGPVEILMDLRADGPSAGAPAGKLMKIRSSGVTFDSKGMRVSTERHAEFEFDTGNGESEGAIYDPGTKELTLGTKVKLDWRGNGGGEPMHLESGHLVYREAASEIFLSPDASLSRGGFRMEAGDTVVLLEKGNLRRVEAVKASGVDRVPGRDLTFEAPRLNIDFAAGGVIQHLQGSDSATLVSSTAAAQTRVNADRIDLDFQVKERESVLEKGLASGKARVESKALPKAGQAPQPARILTSDVVALQMQPGGKEIAHVETHTPGQVEFPPAKPGDKRRVVEGERLYIDYGTGNVIESFRAIQAKTRADGIGKDKKPLVTKTSSQDLQAWFDPNTGQMTRLEQWTRFEYEEGTRRARADRALMDQVTGLITLRKEARMWDESGSTAGDEIVIEQATGDMAAVGNVTSTRLPDNRPNAKKSDTLVSNKEPVQAKAQRMTTMDGTKKIRYEGGAVLWQGASRITADTVLIDQEAERLEANRNVVTTLPDRRDENGKGGSATTVVKAPKFVYDGKTKLGDYTGGAEMTRPTLHVKSRRLRAWFVDVPKKDGGTESQLDRIFADGAVEFVERAKDRTRTGSSEHAEHYPREERTVLTGGAPVVNDSLRGVTRGDSITWVAREDRLIVDNTGSGPAVSRIQREKRN